MSTMTTFAHSRISTPVRVLAGLAIILLILVGIAMNSGALSVPLRSLFSRHIDDGLWQIWLTIRLPRVLLAVLDGQLNKQIAFNLNISEATVKAHMTAIMRKLDVRNRTQAAIVARSLGLDLRH